MLARVSVEEAISIVEPNVARKLELTKELKRFAYSELALPKNSSYSSYVALQRDFPVWIVIAAPRFSLEAQQWCYLVVGCASYRGYFSQAAAQEFANNLNELGFDTHVAGAAAYSTLGWFSDPLLPSMLLGTDAAIAELLFHELAHQKLYLKGESEFNEAFASFIGQQGAIRWLRQSQPQNLGSYEASLEATNDFSNLIVELKADLERLYSTTIEADIKEQFKAQHLEEFRASYKILKAQRWQNKGYFDNWMLKPINNARLAAYATYHEMIPEFERLFENCDHDFERLYATLKSSKLATSLDNC